MNKVDIIVIVVLSLIMAQGASQGFLRSLCGPISLILSSVAGYCTLLVTRNIIPTLGVTTLMLILSTWLFNSLLYLWTKKHPNKIIFLSRLTGALINLTWIGTALAGGFLLATTVRLSDPQWEEMRQFMKESSTCSLLEEHLLGMQPPSPETDSSCPEKNCDITPAEAQALIEDVDIQELIYNEKIKNLISDPGIREAIEKKNIYPLLSSYAIVDFLLDTKLIVQIIKIYPKIRAATSPKIRSEATGWH